ncbi:MAG: hypothetical protein ABSH34_00210 [Verrucomicrobiota bacterium]
MSTVLTVFTLPYLPPSTKLRCAPSDFGLPKRLDIESVLPPFIWQDVLE